jgi:hypothetical protein
MAENSIGRRMADFYFEITDADGNTKVYSSADAQEDEMEEEEED